MVTGFGTLSDTTRLPQRGLGECSAARNVKCRSGRDGDQCPGGCPHRLTPFPSAVPLSPDRNLHSPHCAEPETGGGSRARVAQGWQGQVGTPPTLVEARTSRGPRLDCE